VRALLLENPHTARRILAPLVPILILVGVVTEVFAVKNATEIVSAILLVVTSVICRRILDLRRPPNAWMFFGPWRIWAFISLGFLFLAFDELWSIHERIDQKIHAIFSLEETAFTDRIDDFIVLFYGVIGAILIYAHLGEFRSLTSLRKYLGIGFVLLFLMILVDAGTNRKEYIDFMNIQGEMRDIIVEVAWHTENVLKLMSEAVFLFGFLAVFCKFFDGRAIAAFETSHRQDFPNAY
jgi:hypothetical protein